MPTEEPTQILEIPADERIESLASDALQVLGELMRSGSTENRIKASNAVLQAWSRMPARLKQLSLSPEQERARALRELTNPGPMMAKLLEEAKLVRKEDA